MKSEGPVEAKLEKVFEFLKFCEAKKLSIWDPIKYLLSEKVKPYFENCQKKDITRKFLNFILTDLAKKRNKYSNPSLFIKFISINNFKHMTDADLENIAFLCLEKLNVYISCDKNLLSLLYTIIKKSNDKLKKKTKQRVFEEVINSFFLYFNEFQNPSLMKDKEILKNFISHYKLFVEFGNKKAFKNLPKKQLDLIILISLSSYYIDSSFQQQIFAEIFWEFQIDMSIFKVKENNFYYNQAKT